QSALLNVRRPLPPTRSSTSASSPNHCRICSGSVTTRHTTSSGASMTTSFSIARGTTPPRVLQPLVAFRDNMRNRWLRIVDSAVGGYKACSTRSFRRSEEHTSELQSRVELVCRVLLEKKKRDK